MGDGGVRDLRSTVAEYGERLVQEYCVRELYDGCRGRQAIADQGEGESDGGLEQRCLGIPWQSAWGRQGLDSIGGVAVNTVDQKRQFGA